MSKILESLPYLRQPATQDRRSFYENSHQQDKSVAQAYRDTLQDLFCSDEFSELIQQGYITLGMIKPALHESLEQLSHDRQPDRALNSVDVVPTNDADLVEMIVNRIHSPLEVLARIDLTMTPEMIDIFYTGKPKEKQSVIPPIKPDRYGYPLENRWQEYAALMQRGPCTVLILYSADGKAVQQWREHIGDDWNIARLRQTAPQSERAVFALDDNHNNIFHGSDSPESAAREIGLVMEMLSK